MPVHKVKGGYQWGEHGKVYKSKAKADRQRRAAFAHGYKGKTFALTSKGAIEFACNSKACAPPPVGKGGSGDGGGSGHGDGTAKGYGGLGYANSKLSKSRAPGADPNVSWVEEGSDTNKPLIGIGTTPGGRRFPIAWDEFSVGPQTAKIVINQYAKLLDLYPDVPAIPIGIGSKGIDNVIEAKFGKDPYYKHSFADAKAKAAGFAVHDRATSQPLFVAFTGRMDQRMVTEVPEQWGTATRTLNHAQERQYIVTHEFGHMLDATARMGMAPVQKLKLDSGLEKTRQEAELFVTDIGNYGKKQTIELTAEAFAVQSHGLAKSDSEILRKATDHMLDGKAPKPIEWES